MRFLRDEQGAMIVVVALGLSMLVLMGGAAMDIGIANIYRYRAQSAVDVAALSAASMDEQVGNDDNDKLIAVAKRYLQLNTAGLEGVNREKAKVTMNGNNIAISLPTQKQSSFLQLAGIEELRSNTASRVALPKAAPDFDIVLMMDESGSTSLPADRGLKRRQIINESAIKFIDKVLDEGRSKNPNVRIGIVGYSTWIVTRYGLTNKYSDLIEGINILHSVSANFEHVAFYAAQEMVLGRWDPAASNGWVDRPNPPPAYYKDIISYIKIPPAGVTRTLPGDSKFPNVSPNRFVVMISDGQLMTPSSPASAPPCPEDDRRCFSSFLAKCNELKSNGITIMQVVYAQLVTAAEEAVLQQCSSKDPKTGKPMYAITENQQQLDEFLDSAAVVISKIRILE